MSQIIEYCRRDRIDAALKGDNVYYITDTNVDRLFGPFGSRGFVIEAGEDSKKLEMVERIAADMMNQGCNRKTTVIAVGGGVVGDLAGFIAAVYMRGVNWINVPTTLLAQVDSSVGGKTAVDICDYKNIVGAFHMPDAVLICSDWLSALPEREWKCGLGEIIKTAFLDKKIFAFITKKFEAVRSRDEITARKIIKLCVAFKEDITSKDFYETGLRKILNLGHTLGHALEKLDGHSLSHGEYVLQGLAAEARVFKDEIEPAYYHTLLTFITSLTEIQTIDIEAAAEAALHDKKNDSNMITIIISPQVGKTEEKLIAKEDLIAKYNRNK